MRVAHGVVLDREETEFYDLVLQAADGGTPPRNSTVTLDYNSLLLILFRFKICLTGTDFETAFMTLAQCVTSQKSPIHIARFNIEYKFTG